MKKRLIPTVAAVLLCLPALPAAAAVPNTLYADASCAAFSTAPLSYVFCDDGIPAAGGETANAACESAGSATCKAVTVPARYRYADPSTDTFTGLPPRAADAGDVPGADANGDIALDIDVTVPLTPPPAGGYPLLFFMHGCCAGNKTGWESGTLAAAGSFDAGGEKWHYSNAWFASRGYVVINYTARGFVKGQNETPAGGGSTGQAEVDSRSYEINDFQHVACQVFAAAGNWTGKAGAGGGSTVAINPSKVFMTGGSYGGGFSWMGLTDPVWTCTDDTGTTQQMKLAAVAPRYGWTDLLHSLVPTGRYIDGTLPSTDGCDSGPLKIDGTDCPGDQTPTGIPKKTIDAALYASGATGVPPGSSHTTFPPKIADAIACLQSNYPVENSPACITGANGTHPLADTLPEFGRERSAYYQNDWFAKIATDAGYRIPVFVAATLTDPLFPAYENRRMYNRLKAVVPGYPIQMHYADHQHFVQNKARDWGDVCGVDRHVCANADYALAAGGYDFNSAEPAQLRRVGISSRLNRFFDYYARPASNPSPAAPAFDVTVTLQVCPGIATEVGIPANESADIFTAPTFAALTNGQVYTLGSSTAQTTTPTTSDPFNAQAEPIANQQSNAGGACPVRNSGSPAPAGEVATYNSGALADDVVMIGGATITAVFTTTDQTNPVTGVNNLQLNGRLFDVFPSGNAALVDRGPRRISPAEMAAGSVTFQLHGNAYRFLKGHQIRLELLQDDDPYFKRSDAGGGMSLTSVQVSVPRRVPANRSGVPVVRAASTTAAGGATDVAAGEFALYDNGDQGHVISAITLGVENPAVLTALRVEVENQAITVNSPTASNEITLTTPVKVRPGGRINFTVTADLGTATAAAGMLTNAAYASGLANATPDSGVGGGLAIVLALALWRAQRRRLGLALIVASLALLSCRSNGGAAGPPPLSDNQARISLTGVTGTADDAQPAAYGSLPAIVGTLTRN
jgi:acetyl esterase/lipase